MLPSAQGYLSSTNLAPAAAAYVTIGSFLGGVIGIQAVSRLLHHYIPSHVVDCDHSHSGDEDNEESHDQHNHQDSVAHKQIDDPSETTPLLCHDDIDLKSRPEARSRSATAGTLQSLEAPYLNAPALEARPTLQSRLTARVSNLVAGRKSACDNGGPCYGYSEPCGQECFKAISRVPTNASGKTFGRFSFSGPANQPSLLRAATTAPYSQTQQGHTYMSDVENALHGPKHSLPQKHGLPMSQDAAKAIVRGRAGERNRSLSHTNTEIGLDQDGDDHADPHEHTGSTDSSSDTANDPSHHHHVPTNAFLAIGLQTSIAIALHKLPEGFITYATNHANPKLGFSVFMALFIHNITEGFAMALPLYLAINSRWQAMFWSSLLGGVSQPLGAGVAALWFKIAGRGDGAPGDIVYGCMFAITSGIMASVALQLFSESLTLTHNRNLCIAFAFIGMGILGVSYALTA